MTDKNQHVASFDGTAAEKKKPLGASILRRR